MISALNAEIAASFRDGGDWCDLEKAQTLAALIVGLRPRVVVEIGVWMGGSMVPMLMALRALSVLDAQAGRRPVARRAVAIDAWSREASVAGQEAKDAEWWGQVDHEAAYQAFLGRLERHGLACDVLRQSSGSAEVPRGIGLLHVDGNHADQAALDTQRFAPAVHLGGILVMDDLHWRGGHVQRARGIASFLGFHEVYPLGTGVVMQRTSYGTQKMIPSSMTK